MSDVLLLMVEGQTSLAEARWTSVERALSQLGFPEPTFVILADQTGSYVQTAGTPERLTVEWRRYDKDSFRHFVAGHLNARAQEDYILASEGHVAVQSNEVLKLGEALQIFAAFTKKQLPLANFQWRELPPHSVSIQQNARAKIEQIVMCAGCEKSFSVRFAEDWITSVHSPCGVPLTKSAI